MNGKPHMVRTYSGRMLMHETRIINVEPLTNTEVRMNGEDIVRLFTGGRKVVGLDNGRTVITGKDVSTADSELEITLPPEC